MGFGLELFDVILLVYIYCEVYEKNALYRRSVAHTSRSGCCVYAREDCAALKSCRNCTTCPSRSTSLSRHSTSFLKTMRRFQNMTASTSLPARTSGPSFHARPLLSDRHWWGAATTLRCPFITCMFVLICSPFFRARILNILNRRTQLSTCTQSCNRTMPEPAVGAGLEHHDGRLAQDEVS